MVSLRPRVYKFFKKHPSRVYFRGWEGIFLIVITLEVSQRLKLVV